jgi:hypothetical protein
MLKVEIQGDDTFQIDANIVVRDIGLEPFEVQRLMVRLRTGAGNGQPFFRALYHMAWARMDCGEAAGFTAEPKVELMEVDTAAFAGLPGLEALDIAPTPMEAALKQILAKR